MASSVDEELERILKEEQRNAEMKMTLGGAPQKSQTTALLLAVALGWIGVDRFYLGYAGWGILKLCTCGGFCVLWIIDIILILFNSLKPANGTPYVEDFNKKRGT